MGLRSLAVPSRSAAASWPRSGPAPRYARNSMSGHGETCAAAPARDGRRAGPALKARMPTACRRGDGTAPRGGASMPPPRQAGPGAILPLRGPSLPSRPLRPGHRPAQVVEAPQRIHRPGGIAGSQARAIASSAATVAAWNATRSAMPRFTGTSTPACAVRVASVESDIITIGARALRLPDRRGESPDRCRHRRAPAPGPPPAAPGAGRRARCPTHPAGRRNGRRGSAAPPCSAPDAPWARSRDRDAPGRMHAADGLGEAFPDIRRIEGFGRFRCMRSASRIAVARTLAASARVRRMSGAGPAACRSSPRPGPAWKCGRPSKPSARTER